MPRIRFATTLAREEYLKELQERNEKALKRNCPYCLARKGQPCKTFKGGKASQPHLDRTKTRKVGTK